MTIFTQKLQPLQIWYIQNLTPNDVTYLQDSPDAVDANNLVPTSATTQPKVELHFGQLVDAVFTGTQTIRVSFVDNNWVGLHVEVYSSGALVHTSAVSYNGYGDLVAEFAFDASLLTNKDGLDVSVILVGHVYAGTTINQIRAVEWVATLDDSGAAPPPDTTPPGEITNLTEEHTDTAVHFTWTRPTDADFSHVDVYRDGVRLAGDLQSSFTDTSVQPSTTYQYVFYTIDDLGNQSAGAPITITTMDPITYEHLKPTQIVSINNLTPNAVTYIQDDPTAEDAYVMVPIDNLSAPSIRLKIQAPQNPISGLQTIRWVVDDPNFVGSRVRVYENGVQILDSGIQYPLNGTEPMVFVFNADAITDKTLQSIEMEFVSTLYSGLTVDNLGAIEWENALQYTDILLNGSINASSGVAADTLLVVDGLPPGEITNLTEQHTDIAVVFNWSEPTDADFSHAEVYRDGAHLASDLRWNFTDTSVQPSTTYQYVFHTVDNVGNLSAGVPITVTTSDPITYENLPPTQIVSINNLTPNDISYIQDSPEAEDANVMVPIDNLSAPSIRVKFAPPANPIEGLQTIRWVVDDPDYMGSRVRVYENGVLILESKIQYPLNGTNPVVFVFDAGAITDKTLQNVEVEWVSTLYGGLMVDNLGAIEWRNALQFVDVPLDGAVSASSGVAADTLQIRTAIPLNVAIAASSTISAQLQKAVPISSSLSASSGISADTLQIRTAIPLSGSFGATSNVEAVLQKAVPITSSFAASSGIAASLEKHISLGSTLSIDSDLSASLQKSVPMAASLSVRSDVFAYMLQTDETIHALVQSNSSTYAEISITRGLNGQFQGVSTVESSLLEKSFGFTGNSGALSDVMELPLLLHRDLSGNVGSETYSELDLELHRHLFGDVAAVSSVNMREFGTLHSLSGDIAAVSDVMELMMQTVKGLNGALGSESYSELDLLLQMDVQGSIIAGSTAEAELQLRLEIEGISGAYGNILDPRLFVDRGLSSTISAETNILLSFLSNLREFGGNIAANTEASGKLDRATGIRGSLAAQSQVEDLLLPIYRDMSGSLESTSGLSAYFDVDGQVVLSGSLTPKSSLYANLSHSVSFYGDIFSDSEINSAVLEKSMQLEGGLDAISSMSSTLSRSYPLTSSIAAVSEVHPLEIEHITGLMGAITEAAELDAELQRELLLSGEVEASLQVELSLILEGSISLEGALFGEAILAAGLDQLTGLVGAIVAVSGTDVRAPVNLYLEVDNEDYDGIEERDDGLWLSHTITEGIGRHIEFILEFEVVPLFLEKAELIVKGTVGEPFTLQPWNVKRREWDRTQTITYNGIYEEYVSLEVRDFESFIDSENKLKIKMRSINSFTSGALTLSSDYAELRKTYIQYQ